MFVRLLFAIDYLAAAVLLWFLLMGLGDGSVSAYNAGIWTVLVTGFAAILIGGHILYANGKRALAGLLLAILAAPAALYGGFVALLIILNPSWH